MARRLIAAHFELYALRDGRWLMDACFGDEAEARTAAERSRRAGGVRGVRLIRELTLPNGTEPIVSILYDSTQPDPPHAFATNDRASGPAAATSKPEPQAQGALRTRHQEDRHAGPVPAASIEGSWLAYIAGGAGLAILLGVLLVALV